MHNLLHVFHIGTNYGMFARMTTDRYEVVLHGSGDGMEWREYAWQYKAGEINTHPHYCPVGHMPRLDWKLCNKRMPEGLMRGGEPPDWFDRFVQRLLEGSSDVLSLIGPNRFVAGFEVRPKFVKVQIYEYRFAGSRNVAAGRRQIVPASGGGGRDDEAWEHGVVWQRKWVKTVKLYTLRSGEDLRVP